MNKLLPLILALVLFGQGQASAVNIIEIYDGGTPPTNSIGGGNLTNICHQACLVWETIFPGTNVIKIHFLYKPIGSGGHDLITQGGTPSRETEGRVYFNNDNVNGHDRYYLPTNCFNTAEYTNGYREESFDFGCGPVNETRVFSGGPVGNGQNINMFNVALHEIGHVLNMSVSNNVFLAQRTNNTIPIRSPVPYAGSVIPLQPNNAHIDYMPWPYQSRTVMNGSFAAGELEFPSIADIITLAQLSGYTNMVLHDLTSLPQLRQSLVKQNGTACILVSWDQKLVSYTLQQCTDMSGTWANVKKTPTLANGVYSVMVPLSGSQCLFRLKSN